MHLTSDDIGAISHYIRGRNVTIVDNGGTA